MELFKLFGSIAVDNADANKAIDETGEKAESFSSKLGNGIKTAAKWGTAIVAGASTAVAGLAKFAQSSAATADNIDKMSQKIGISREAYQELDFICSQSGTSVDSLQMGMKSLLTAMDGAVSGTESNIAQFERLGVTVTDANGNLRSQEEVMWDVMAALQSMDNQAEKARLANELFGRSGSELMPLLNGEAGSIEAMKEQAHELGLVLGDELVDNGVVLTDTLDQTKRAFSSIVTQLGGSLMPILTKVLTYIQKSLPSINALVGKLAPVLATLFDSLLPPLMELAEEVFPILFDLIEMLIPPVAEIVRSLLPLITSLLSSVIKPLVQLVKSVLPPLIKVVQAVIPPLIEIIQSILPVLTRLVEALTPIIVNIIEAILPVIIELVNALLPIIKQFIDTMLPIMIDLINRLTPIFKQIIEKLLPVIIDLVKMLTPLISNIISAVLPVVIQLLNTLTPLIEYIITNILPIVIQLIETLIPIIMKIIERILPIVIELVNKVVPILMKIIEAILPVIISLLDILTPILEALMPILEPILELLMVLLEPLFQILEIILPPLTTLLQFLANIISTVVKPIIEWVASFLSGTLTGELDGIRNLIGNVGGAFKSVWEGIKSVWSGAGNFFGGIWNGIKNAFSNVTDWFKNVFSNAWQAVKNVFSTGGKIFDGIKDGIVTAFKAVVNAIIKGINKVIALPFNAINGILGKIKGISIVGIKPFDWIKLFSVPQIPLLRKGGVLKKGQTGFLEGDGDEAVVPLEQNTGWINKIADKLYALNAEADSNKLKSSETPDRLATAVKEGLEGQTAVVSKMLNAILQAIYKLDEGLGDKLYEAMTGLQFRINEREFARLVKGV